MKPTATSRSAFTNSLSRHRHHQRSYNVHAATAAKPNVSACICKQANVSLPWRRSRQSAMPMRACVQQMTHKPTDIRQRITASSRSAAKHQQTSPKMLGQFPLQPNGGGRGVRWARIVLRLRSADREPANPFPAAVEVCDGTQAPGSLVESCVKCPE
jgi:hypothetical protein